MTNHSALGTLTNAFDYETMDFEVGYRPALPDSMNVRLFAGVRGLHYKDSISASAVASGGSGGSGGPDKIGYGVDYSEEFFGVGPRLGVEVSAPIGDSMFGVSGMVAGAALFGTARQDVSVWSGGGLPISLPGAEESRVVYNLEAALGLDMHLDPATTVTLGYRTEGLFGIGSTSGGPSVGDSDTRWTHGPTLKLTGYFD